MKSKSLTNRAKVISACIAVIGLLLKSTGLAPELNIDDVLKVSAFVALIFSTIDVSLILQNIFTKKELI